MSISRSMLYSPSRFASAMVKCVKKETMVEMAKRDGAFVVAALLERIKSEGHEEERRVVKSWFGKQEVRELKDGVRKGREVLLKQLDDL
jgi:pumilio homology domain family member 6